MPFISNQFESNSHHLIADIGVSIGFAFDSNNHDFLQHSFVSPASTSNAKAPHGYVAGNLGRTASRKGLTITFRSVHR
jgi:hypothetical protein